MPNLKEQIAALAKPKLVQTTFGGIDAFLRRWNEREQIEWAIEVQTAKKPEGVDSDLFIRCKAIARSLCDENGVLLYGADNFAGLAEMDSEILDPVWEQVITLQSRTADADAKKN